MAKPNVSILIRELQDILAIESDFSISNQCSTCTFPVKNDGFIPNSSENDVILTVAFNKLTNLPTFIRTLRHTGCKARVVIICNSYVFRKYSTKYFNYMKKCGIQFINIGPMKPPDSYGVFYIRHRLYYDFLRSNRGKINRVISIDLYDTAFQRDPFTTFFKPDRVYFNSEIVSVVDNYIFHNLIMQTMKIAETTIPDFKILQECNTKILHNPLINGGFQSGGAEMMEKLYYKMQNIGNLSDLSAFGDDQAFLNVFVHCHYFDNIINYSFDENCIGSSIIGYGYAVSNAFYPGPIGSYRILDKIPAVFHQFDRFGQIMISIDEYCPNSPYLKDNMRNF